MFYYIANEEGTMQFIDYREALGLGFDDEFKKESFFNRMFMYIDFLLETDEIRWNIIYANYCLVTASSYQDEYSSWGEKGILYILQRHRNSIKDFLLYYIPLVNILTNDEENSKKMDYYKFLIETLDGLHIDYEIIDDKDGKFIFPKGAKELDLALVSEPLTWLQDYPKSKKAFIKALKDYSDKQEDNISNIADEFRKALETFFQEFFDSEKSLENYKSEYGSYLKDKGVPKEIANDFNTILNSYTTFINNYAKHHDKTSENVLEYIMYQTGNIIRLLITL